MGVLLVTRLVGAWAFAFDVVSAFVVVVELVGEVVVFAGGASAVACPAVRRSVASVVLVQAAVVMKDPLYRDVVALG